MMLGAKKLWDEKTCYYHWEALSAPDCAYLIKPVMILGSSAKENALTQKISGLQALCFSLTLYAS